MKTLKSEILYYIANSPLHIDRRVLCDGFPFVTDDQIFEAVGELKSEGRLEEIFVGGVNYFRAKTYTGILNAQQITQLAIEKEMIAPFHGHQIRFVKDIPAISYGCGGFGYDFRLSPKDFRIFRHIPGRIVDPKRFDEAFLESATLQTDDHGAQYFVIPGNSYALGTFVERLSVPHDVLVMFLGKSTYARCGAIVNVTPGEAGWQGFITVEISNASPSDLRVYANEGIAQALFFKGLPTDILYGGRKYQDQENKVITARL